MRKILSFFLPAFLFASILSHLKNRELEYDKQNALQNAIQTKRSWINPVILQYQYNKSYTDGTFSATAKIYSVSVNQPIFKSGAIYYSIRYANLQKNYSLASLEIQKRALIKQAYDLVYEYKITNLNEEILKLQIQNAKINVKRKKEEFASGEADSSELDNAILNLNSLKLSLADLKISKKQIENSFANISDLNISEVKLPVFKAISKKEFLNDNLNYYMAKINAKMQKDLYKMQIGNQLFTVSLNGNYAYQKNETPLGYTNQHTYSFGFSVTLPLSVNAKPQIEQAKIAYLKSKISLMDKKRELINNFDFIVYQIKTLKRKLKIYDQNIKIYDNLIKNIKDSIKAGNATEDDLTVMENSRKVAVLNKKIIKLQIQQLLLDLYYQLSTVSFSNN